MNFRRLGSISSAVGCVHDPFISVFVPTSPFHGLPPVIDISPQRQPLPSILFEILNNTLPPPSIMFIVLHGAHRRLRSYYTLTFQTAPITFDHV